MKNIFLLWSWKADSFYIWKILFCWVLKSWLVLSMKKDHSAKVLKSWLILYIKKYYYAKVMKSWPILYMKNIILLRSVQARCNNLHLMQWMVAFMKNWKFPISNQCDQIWQFIGLWASFKSFWQQLICPNLPHS